MPMKNTGVRLKFQTVVKLNLKLVETIIRIINIKAQLKLSDHTLWVGQRI